VSGRKSIVGNQPDFGSDRLIEAIDFIRVPGAFGDCQLGLKKAKMRLEKIECTACF
jgi:hypothetical protein